MKFTIRFSISSLFAILIVAVSLTIIVMNYHTVNNIMLNSAKELLNKSSELMQQNIYGYLSDIKKQTTISAELVKDDMISFDRPKELKKFLLNIVVNQPSISSAYLATKNGSFYSIRRRLVKDKLTLRIINREKQPYYRLDTIMEMNGKAISTTKTADLQYDPRIRPWYLATEKKRAFNWSSIYKFARGDNIFGVTASSPIYDPQGKLQAIFAIDATINIFSEFLSNLLITPNTFVYIMDSAQNVISASKIITKDQENKLQTPWVKYSYDLFSKNRKPMFDFNYAKNSYIAKYQIMRDLLGGDTIVAIVLPVKDITSSLQFHAFLFFLMAFVILMMGLNFVSLLASRISKPIIQAADEAKDISEMKINEDRHFVSSISELIDMHAALTAMKKSLRSFVRYVPDVLVKQLMKSGEIAKVGGKSTNMTVLFSDIEGFTSLSEPMDPPVLMEYLSDYFQAMSKIIHKYNGTIDKFVGDGIMAFWGAPLEDNQHAIHSCYCALAMLEELKQLNKYWRSKNRPEIKIRIGINTSEVVVGNVGSDDRLSYTVIGDGVNLASRLEALNKNYHTRILVGEETREQAKDHFAFRFVDKVVARGKTKGGPVYELLKTDKKFFRILQISDSHLFANTSKTFLNLNTYNSLKSVINIVQKSSEIITPDLTIFSGDISHDRSSQSYDNFATAITELKSPKIWFPGNHDDFLLGKETLAKHNIPYIKEITLGNWQLIMLNSHWEQHASGILEQNELDFLNTSLNKSSNKHALIFIHHHPLPLKCTWLDTTILENWQQLQDIIKSHSNIKAVVFGHIHAEKIVEMNNIKYIGTPSTSFQFNIDTQQFELDKKMPGFRWLNLFENGDIETGVERVSFDNSLLPDLESSGYK